MNDNNIDLLIKNLFRSTHLILIIALGVMLGNLLSAAILNHQAERITKLSIQNAAR